LDFVRLLPAIGDRDWFRRTPTGGVIDPQAGGQLQLMERGYRRLHEDEIRKLAIARFGDKETS